MDTMTRKEAEELGIINADGLGFVKPQTAFKNINERLLSEIKKDNLIWRQGWSTGVTIKGKTYGAQNYETQRPYTGGNAFFINMQNLLNGTNYRFFLTAKQISERGGKIKFGAKPFPVSVFIKNLVTVNVTIKGKKEQVTTEERGMVWYQVFPIDLVEGLKEIKRKTLKPDTFNEVVVADADTLIENMPKAPLIKHGGDEAYYMPSKDYVQLPLKKAFKPQQNYYSVAFHELIHSTKHSKRLDRGNDIRSRNGSKEDKKAYAFEELIAEIGAAYLCGVCEIDYYTINNSAAYLKGWASRLTDEINADPNFLKRAVFKAARGANFIIGTTLEKHGVIKSLGKIEVKEKPFKGKEITPNKAAKASIKQAIEDLMSLPLETFSVFKNNPPNLKNIGFMALNLFYSKFKNLDVDDKIEVNGSLSESLLTKVGNAGLLDYNMKFDNEAELTEVGKKIIEKIKARMETLKAKKSGTDLFPELAGVTDVLFTFLNSFLGLDNTVVSRANLTHLINTLHAAVKGKAIKPNHPLKSLVNQTQTKIVNLINSLSATEKIKLNITNRQEIESKISSLSGLGFWNVIASAVIGKGAELLANKHIFNKKTTEPKALSGVMTVTQAINSKYNLIGLDGDYLKLIGEACKPTSFFIYGPGGSGKSTFTIKFANYMAQKDNKILYVAGEQYDTPVFSKMLQRLKILDSPNFVIVKDLNTVSPKDFDFIVIDSKDSLGFEIKDFNELQKKYPKISTVILSHGTKSGGFTGSEKWRNLAETMIYCKDLVAHTNTDKNRWGGNSEVKILKLK